MNTETPNSNGGVREEMKEFWTDQSKKHGVCGIDKNEIEEIVGYFPDLTGKRVLELGSGTGRLTTRLAEVSNHVVAVDFVESFTNKNKETNAFLKNIQFICTDVMDLFLEENCVDVIFSNGVFTYLEDEEIHTLTKRMLNWLKPNGKLVFCEFCYSKIENDESATNKVFYRSSNSYNKIVTSPSVMKMDKCFGFDLISRRSVEAFAKENGKRDLICWLMEPATRDLDKNQGYETFQKFLDEKQYSKNGILRYEMIFGKDYISTGGHATTEEFCAKLGLQTGSKVLDVGCGIGGSAFHMGRKYGAEVIGIDLSSNMVDIARERQAEYKIPKISFEVADATKVTYPEASFDVVYSRDTILHIQDKLSLFKSFYKWLKPGGKIFITDYTCGPHVNHSEQFKDYVKQRGYHLLTDQQYGEVLSLAGFKNVKALDQTDNFVGILDRELADFEKRRDEFRKKFSLQDYQAIRDGWEAKLKRCRGGDQKWGSFYGERA